MPQILVIPGSLRTGSHNARLAALAPKELTLADAELAAEVPAAAVALKRMVMAHQGVFITSPEYSASVTPLLKNTIDWISRGRDRGEPNYAAFKGRVFALGAASSGSGGGVHSLMALRQILELGCGALVLPEQISVPRAAQAFDDMDNLKDEAQDAALRTVARRLVELAGVIS